MNKSRLRIVACAAVLFPFDLVVAVSLLTAQLIGLPVQLFSRRARAASPLRRSPSVAIIIVSWDGKHLLEEGLPHVLAAADGADILVVDNGSSDGTVSHLRLQFPQVQVLALDRNYGFSVGNNLGAKRVEAEIVVFLNNDMIVSHDFLKPLVEPFSDPAVFATTSQIFLADDSGSRAETGNTRGLFQSGFFSLAHAPVESSQPAAVLWAGGGSSAIDRRKFLEIGGFDALYHPFYVEDLDLSYQAWKRGWKCLLAPASQVVHKHRGTSRPKFGNDFVDNTIRKNQYLFIWKNLTDISMLLEHLVNLPRNHIRGMLARDPDFEMRAFFRALRSLPTAIWKRLSALPHYKLSDREVLQRSQPS